MGPEGVTSGGCGLPTKGSAPAPDALLTGVGTNNDGSLTAPDPFIRMSVPDQTWTPLVALPEKFALGPPGSVQPERLLPPPLHWDIRRMPSGAHTLACCAAPLQVGPSEDFTTMSEPQAAMVPFDWAEQSPS